jgi:SAM-dependent methyltransferase
MKKIIRKIHWILSAQFGIDLRRLARALAGIPRYGVAWFRFRKSYQGRLDFLPCLSDWYEEGGTTQTEYFLQDLHVARAIHKANPQRHVDIGSRIDGFVAHLASFRDVEVFDIRPVTSVIEGVVFRQADLMNPPEALVDYCDSLSCLHALEHFGLGRYGDPINPQGYVAGFENMVKILRPRGTFYLAVPVGQERVEFNAHRVFNPLALVQLATDMGLTLAALAWVDTDHKLMKAIEPQRNLATLSGLGYSLGIFTFVKK